MKTKITQSDRNIPPNWAACYCVALTCCGVYNVHSPDENIPYETFQKFVIYQYYIRSDRSIGRLTLAVKVFFLIDVVLGLPREGKIAIKL